MKNRSIEIRSNEIRIRQELPVISLVDFWGKIGITYQSFKDFFDQLKQILQNTIVKVKVSKLADGFGEQDIIYEQ